MFSVDCSGEVLLRELVCEQRPETSKGTGYVGIWQKSVADRIITETLR